MNIVTAKCPNCGATLKVNAETTEGLCQFCGTPFFTKEAIINYNTTVINNTTNNTVNNTYIKAESLTVQSKSFDNLFSAGINSWKARDYNDAYEKFSKALELRPDEKACAIYKSLCLAITKRNIAGATSTFETIFLDPNFSYKQELPFVKSHLVNFHNIAVAEYDATIGEFSPNYPDNTLILRAWQSLDNLLAARKLMVEIAEKIYKNDSDYKSELLTHLKSLLEIYDSLTAKWKRWMPIDYSYHVTDYHPQRDVYLSERSGVFKKIKDLDIQYEKTEKTKSNTQKADRIFKALTICGTIGVALMLGIIIVGLAVYGHVYIFNGFVFTAVLSVISIILMITCFCDIITQLILTQNGKATFPKSTAKRVLIIILAIACLALSIYAL